MLMVLLFDVIKDHWHHHWALIYKQNLTKCALFYRSTARRNTGHGINELVPSFCCHLLQGQSQAQPAHMANNNAARSKVHHDYDDRRVIVQRSIRDHITTMADARFSHQ